MSGDDALLIERKGPLVQAIFNRPARRNALSMALLRKFDALIEELSTDKTVRVLVISGAGGHFCAGMDLTDEAPPTSPEEKQAAQRERNRRTAARFAAIAALPQVVIAKVNGAAYAGGLGFVCAADIAIADATARFAAPEVRRGLVPAQILPWLAQRMGRSAARRMVLQANVIDADKALSLGLIHELTPDFAALDTMLSEILADILKAGPGAIAETKGLLAALGSAVPEDYAEAGAAAFARAAASEAKEGIVAFKEKRDPPWVMPLPL
ncbi:enoyl-CoA hydratase/isomerase family protein [Acetobacteraceae bacterium H6797]|nr:enoyl-CoA hydratase/isomerase family protein [Acetobacteraceae bacterium H6797]